MPEHLTAGLAGDLLIARRQRRVCVGCGVIDLVVPEATTGTPPLLCAGCLTKRPKARRFNAKAEKARGLEHLDRLLATTTEES